MPVREQFLLNPNFVLINSSNVNFRGLIDQFLNQLNCFGESKRSTESIFIFHLSEQDYFGNFDVVPVHFFH